MVYVDTLNESNDELLQLFSLFDYPGLVYFDKLSERTESAVRAIIAQRNLCICIDKTYWLHYLPKEKALELDVR